MAGDNADREGDGGATGQGGSPSKAGEGALMDFWVLEVNVLHALNLWSPVGFYGIRNQ